MTIKIRKHARSTQSADLTEAIDDNAPIGFPAKPRRPLSSGE
jgi:hypothetical protein